MRVVVAVSLVGVGVAALLGGATHVDVQEAVEEAEDRNVPLVVVLDGPEKIACLEKTNAVVLRSTRENLDAIVARWSCDARPVALIEKPRSRAVRVSLDELEPTLAAAEKEFPGHLDHFRYERLRGAWKRATTALHEGKRVVAFAELDAIEKEGHDAFRHLDEARELFQTLRPEAEALLKSIQKARAASDYETMWRTILENDPLDRTKLFTAAMPEEWELRSSLESRVALSKVELEVARTKTAELLAEAATHKAEALRALRKKVPASEVADEDVSVAFWDETKVYFLADGKLFREGKRMVAIGLWLGKDRIAAITWDPETQDFFGLPSGEDSFRELRARTSEERAVLDLVRRKGRFGASPVLPIRIDGRSVHAVSSWCAPCHHWFSIDAGVDLERGEFWVNTWSK